VKSKQLKFTDVLRIKTRNKTTSMRLMKIIQDSWNMKKILWRHHWSKHFCFIPSRVIQVIFYEITFVFTNMWQNEKRLLKVSKSRKQIMKSFITKHTQDSILSEFRSFFGRIRDTKFCIRDLLTFSVLQCITK
jgi:hypothetical protein